MPGFCVLLHRCRDDITVLADLVAANKATDVITNLVHPFVVCGLLNLIQLAFLDALGCLVRQHTTRNRPNTRTNRSGYGLGLLGRLVVSVGTARSNQLIHLCI